MSGAATSGSARCIPSFLVARARKTTGKRIRLFVRWKLFNSKLVRTYIRTFVRPRDVSPSSPSLSSHGINYPRPKPHVVARGYSGEGRRGESVGVLHASVLNIRARECQCHPICALRRRWEPGCFLARDVQRRGTDVYVLSVSPPTLSQSAVCTERTSQYRVTITATDTSSTFHRMCKLKFLAVPLLSLRQNYKAHFCHQLRDSSSLCTNAADRLTHILSIQLQNSK